MEIEKAKMMSTDMTQDNVEKIRALFPNAVTEVVIDNGNVKLAIDFDVLKQELSDSLISDKQERYQMTWPDKKKAICMANGKTTSSLRPVVSSSLFFEKTQNIYIEGDNLEALKLLRETYLSKVDMIYIDPPYNTGNDFLYNDNFLIEENEYLKDSGLIDDLGNRLFQNTDSNGRFHTDWLNMMYSRLKISKDMLSENGVVFISIDENEVTNLTKICDEIFGERCHCSTIIWKNKFGSGAMTCGFIGVHEYILVYSKNPIKNITRTLTDEERDTYNKNRDEKFEKRGGYVTQPLSVTTFGDRPNLKYPITYNGQEIWPEKQWVWEKSRMEKAIENNEVVFNRQPDGSYKLRSKKYLIDENGKERRGKPTTFITDVYTQNGTEDIRKIFGKVIFDYTKPVDLLKNLFSFQINDNESDNLLIMDFFAGSSTTAQAIMELNAEDGGNRKFILVQLPEKCGDDSPAKKMGFNTICELGEERIRRVANNLESSISNKKITNLFYENSHDIDLGFRVLKLDSSNMNEVFYNPNALQQNLLESTVDNVKPDRNGLDLLFQVMLECGALLSSKIEEKHINGKTVYCVSDNYIIACYDNDLDEDTIKEIAKMQPIYASFKDSSFHNDAANINAEQIFKTYSPNTEKIKVI